MKRTTLLYIPILLHICCLTAVYAQPQFQSADYGAIGTQHLYSRNIAGFDDAEIASSGANQTWDVRGLTNQAQNVSTIITRDEGVDLFTFSTFCAFGGYDPFTCLGIYNNTQQAWLQMDTQTLIQFNISNLQHFQRKTGNLLLENFFGFTIDLGGSSLSAVIVYSKPDTILHFPITYADAYNSSLIWHVDLSPTGQNIQYVSHQNRASEVDAWGTIITPYDTFDSAIRVRAEITRTDTITTDSVAVPINIRQVEYTWYDSRFGLPVMQANGIILDTVEMLNTVTYLVDSVCVAPDFTVTTENAVYYVDDTGMTTVDFSLDGAVLADAYTWNFGDAVIETSDGALSHTYLAPGVYTATVTGCRINCLPLNTCVTRNVTFEIADTTSAVHFPDPELAGILVYPNPARSTLTIDIADSKDGLSYSMTDALGNQISTGNLTAGVNTINTEELSAGVYLVNLRDEKSQQGYKAVRVLIMD